MSIAIVAQGTVERHEVAVAAAVPRLLVAGYPNDPKPLVAENVVARGRAAPIRFVRGLFEPHGHRRLARITVAPTDACRAGRASHAVDDREVAAEGTTFEGATLPGRET